MKRLLAIAITALAIFAGQSIYAQDFHYGMTVGVNTSTVKVNDVLTVSGDKGRRVGFYAGIVGIYNFNDQIGLQAEVEYSQEGTKMKVGQGSLNNFYTLAALAPLTGISIPNMTFSNTPSTGLTTIISNITATGIKISGNTGALKTVWNFGLIKVPVMLTYKPIAGLSVMAGPYIALRVSQKVKINSDLDNMLSNVNLAVSYSGTATVTSGSTVVASQPYTGLTTLNAKQAIAMTSYASKLLDSKGILNKGYMENYVEDNLNDYVKKFDFGGSIGAKYALTECIAAQLRWDFSLINNLKDFTAKSVKVNLKGHNNSLKLGLIYMF
ncbi:MAG TPA: outer membrane beta-barrel protein [Candidatus Egerieousia sp.]|nr:outer membrane beta-barrel protein [Candidatus Egerieousia sp.]HPT05786.1 outer membrane beta-barrel protein [Candidatus Egerieousia sp.]